MNSIKEDMLNARKGNLVFQIESENCGKWLHGILSKHLGEERVPNYFKLPLLDTQPEGFVKWVFKGIKKLPSKIHTRLLTVMHLPFGAWKGVWVTGSEEEGKKRRLALVNTDFWKDTVVYLPSMLHKKYEQENVSQAIEVRIPMSGKF